MEHEQHTYICIDLKTFYASVECVDRGLDPLTTCLVVAVQTGEDEISKLEIPVTAGEVKRDSGLYRSYRNVAEQIKEAFDAMGCSEK